MTVTDSDKTTEKISSLSDVMSALKEEGLLSGEETEALASMIGGTKGVKYLDSNVEIYEYDIDSKTYKSLVKTKKVTLEGFGIELDVSAVNGKFVIFCDDSKNKDKIIESFNKLNIK